MKKYLSLASSILFTFMTVDGQSFPGKLLFNTGDDYEITLEVKSTVAQQANGQAIDFTIDATGVHGYKVTNATPDNTTLKHRVSRMVFTFEGMGQNRNFDSDNEKDMNGPFGSTMKAIKERTYDMLIDTNGQVLMVMSINAELVKPDPRMALITNMLKEVLDIVEPPPTGANSFFRVLPAKPVVAGDTWTRSWESTNGSFNMAYILSGSTDSTLLIDYNGSSVTTSKMEMMGNETTTTMNNKTSGRIILDKSTAIIREQTMNLEGTGNTQTAFGTLPVNVKSTSIITVNRK